MQCGHGFGIVVVDSPRCASTDRWLHCCLAALSVKCYAAADFFQNISADPTNTASVFLTSTYGPLADKWQSNSGLYNYALFFIGSQPAGAGTPFLPQEALTTAVDWSPFSPHAATPGGLDVATGWGPTQYGCCQNHGIGRRHSFVCQACSSSSRRRCRPAESYSSEVER